MRIGGVKRVFESEAMGWVVVVGCVVLAGVLIKKVLKVTNKAVTVVSAALYPGTTLTASSVTDIANKIANAWGFFNDDEEAVYNALNRLSNEADLKYLMQVYDNGGEDLATSIRKRMSSSEVQKCNNILAKKGITYRF